MAAAQITITISGVKIEVIGKSSALTKQDIKAAAKQAVKMLDEVCNVKVH